MKEVEKIRLKKFFLKKEICIENFPIFANRNSNGPLAQLNRVFDYGSKGCRFESCMGHLTKKALTFVSAFLFLSEIYFDLFLKQIPLVLANIVEVKT